MKLHSNSLQIHQVTSTTSPCVKKSSHPSFVSFIQSLFSYLAWSGPTKASIGWWVTQLYVHHHFDETIHHLPPKQGCHFDEGNTAPHGPLCSPSFYRRDCLQGLKKIMQSHQLESPAFHWHVEETRLNVLVKQQSHFDTFSSEFQGDTKKTPAEVNNSC